MRLRLLVVCVVVLASLVPWANSGATPVAQPTSLDNGLVAYYDFNDGTAADSSGNGNNGTLFGPTVVPGVASSGLHFNGRDQYIQVPPADSLSLSTAFTISGWAKVTAADGRYITILVKGNMFPLSSAPYAIVYNDTGETIVPHLRFHASDDTQVTMDAAITSTLTLNTWTFFTWRFSDGALAIFKDGVKLGEQDLGFTSLASSTLPLEIGRDIPGITEYFNGTLDEIRIYNRALDDTEIQTLAQRVYSVQLPFVTK